MNPHESSHESSKSYVSEKNVKATVGRIKISNMDLVFKDLQHLKVDYNESDNNGMTFDQMIAG